ncbi:MAG: DUF1806 family protein [Trueperaceae bacterium]
MDEIDPERLQRSLDRRAGSEVYLHLETTTGTYSAMGPEKLPPCIAFVRNARIRYRRGAVRGTGPYRVGLKTDDGWVYGDGLTHATETEDGALLMAGYDDQGRLRMAFELSERPFREGAA